MKSKKLILLGLLVLCTVMLPYAIADPVPGGSGNPHFYLEVADAEIKETGEAIHLTITFAEYPSIYNVVIVNGNFVLNGITVGEGIHLPDGLNNIHASGTAILVDGTWILEGTWAK